MSHVEQIKEKLSIEDLVGSYIKLEKAGSNFKALCPFHHEKTPSFFISPGRGSYYCFGCGMKGDVFSFVQAFEGVDFIGALRILAEKTGINLSTDDFKEKGERERLYQCLNNAVMFFEVNMYNPENKEVLDYLVGRGLTLQTIKEWKLGFAPLEWNKTHLYLKSKGFTDEEIEKTGIIKKADGSDGFNQNARFYDRFRGRIMFPISDSGGRVCGFSGRIFKDDGKSAKYINSPETEIFNKSKILFGLDKAKTAIREKEEIIIVEGQMDIILSHQIGVKNTVAISGTALTDSHAGLLHRYSGKITFALDSDNAGVKAARRSAVIALKEGIEVKVLPIPEGKDPADFILKYGEKWIDETKKSVHIIDFSLDNILERKATGKGLVKEIQENVFPFIFSLPSSMEKSTFLRKISKKTGISEESVIEDYRKAEKKYLEENREIEDRGVQVNEKAESRSKSYNLAERIFGIILWQKGKKEPEIEPESIVKRYKQIVGEENFKKISQIFSPEADKIIIEAEEFYRSSDVASDLNILFIRLEEDYLKGELSKERENISKAVAEGDKEKENSITEKMQKLLERLSKLKKT